MPIPSAESAAGTEAVPEGIRQKPKTLPCRYCQRRFRRLEHVQRHERTHTKEKPFRCSCGKTFGRRDLLVRHEKLVHVDESNKDSDQTPSNTPMPPASPTSKTHNLAYTAPAPNHGDPNLLRNASFQSQISNQMSQMPVKSLAAYKRTPGYSLDLLSDAANHLASSGHHLASTVPVIPQDPGRGTGINGQHPPHFDSRVNEENAMRNSGFQSIEPLGGLEDYNLFLDDFGLSSHYLPAIDAEFPHSLWPRPLLSTQDVHDQMESHLCAPQGGQEENNNSLNHLASRLSSLQPEPRGGPENQTRLPDDTMRNGRAWKISAQDHRTIGNKLENFENVLPKGFALPSRHTLSRFLEGYLNSFHAHLLFLHIPTFSVVNCAPELLLALAAIGAQYRFEGHRGNDLWYAARAIAMEQVRQRNSYQTLEVLSPPATYKFGSAAPSPISTLRQVDPNPLAESNQMKSNESAGNLGEQCSNTPKAQLETIQALLLLMAMGTWGTKALLREGLCLRSQIALLTRELGLDNTEMLHEDASWQDWIQVEGEKRIKFIVFCFFGLQCVAYDIPPLILSSEIKMLLPCSAKEWKAESCRQWKEARRVTPYAEITFHDALGRLVHKSPPQENATPISSLGNYVLIHALVQQIFFIRQTSTTSTPGTANNSLRPEVIDDLTYALRQWQAEWERTPESSLDPSNPNGPTAFNSTALLRLAYIRLHSDLGPCRKLESRDPIRIADAFKNAPPLVRSARLGRAILQSAHALSIPVKIGIAYVARTQTFSWSIQHSLCNLECAFLLSKWLETISLAPYDLSHDERNLLEMVKSMLDETEFAVSIAAQDGMSEGAKIKRLGSAVVRLWAETFKGTHMFEIVKLIGSSLELYAHLLEQGEDSKG